jgi:hypothetical protein
MNQASPKDRLAGVSALVSVSGHGIPKQLDKGVRLKWLANKALDFRNVERGWHRFPTIGAHENYGYARSNSSGFRDYLTAGRTGYGQVKQNHLNAIPITSNKIESSRAIASLDHRKPVLAEHL